MVGKLELLEQDIPDMIICDVMMPEMDGYAFVNRQEDDRTFFVPFFPPRVKAKIGLGLLTGADVYG